MAHTKVRVTALFCAIALCLNHFSLAAHAQQTAKLNIVATTAMVADLVKNIARDNAQVRTLMGEGVDPHLYKPTRSDIAALMQADIVFYNGLLLEGKMTDALLRIASSGKKVHAVTEILDKSFLLEPEGLSGHYDPHVWMDPTAWAKAVEVIEMKLSEFRPDMQPSFKEGLKLYSEKLEALHQYAVESLGSIPPESRILVTAHDAFSYFGRQYGIKVMGIQGLSTDSEAGVKDIERIVDTLVKEKIASVFIESTIPDRSVQALIEGARSKGHSVKIGGELFSDAMGKPNTYEGTYIGMLDHNITYVARGLGGKAPERGMSNMLSKE
jgi:manganese/zinc/iron transport system substrate-binding protein